VPNDDLAVLRACGIVTTRYHSWKPTDGVPVRSTVGEPKFWRGPQLVDGRVLAPFGLLDPTMPDDEARRRYVARLDGNADRIVGTLAEVARSHGGRQLCVLCFENVHAGEVCHRRWFARWFEDCYGVPVPELPGLIEVDQQPRLF
jgi:hypothetical protein